MINYSRLRSNEVRYSLPVRWLLLVIGAVAALNSQSQASLLLVAAYGAFAAATSIYFLGPWSERLRTVWPYWAMQAVDLLTVTALIAMSEGLASPLYLLFPLLALRSLVYGPDVPGVVWLPFAFGPLYVLALLLSYGNLVFIADPLFLTRYLLLLALTVGIVGAGLVLAGRLSEVDRLRAAVTARTEDLANQARTLQRTATDLGDRVLELRTLQEIAKALSATLYLNDTLATVANRLGSITGSPYSAVALLDEGQRVGWIVTAGGGEGITTPHFSSALRDALASALITGRRQVLAESDTSPSLWRSVWPVGALEVIPLVTRGQAIGGLLVGHPAPGDKAGDGTAASIHDPEVRGLTESFAYFAATAVENARLYGSAMDKQRELEAVLAGIGDGVLVVSTSGLLLMTNPVAARIFGLSAASTGIPVTDLVSDPDVLGVLEEPARTGAVVVRELPIPSAGMGADGEPRTFQALAAPIVRETAASEEISGVVTVLRDITGQKELERMKSNFLSVVSHELKTPLHSIKGFVDIILMGKTGPLTELQHDFLGTVQEQTGHLQRLIEDLLEYNRLESGQIKLRPIRLDAAEIVLSVVEKLTPLAANGRLNVTVSLPDHLPEIEADPMRLEQVVTNLVENAIKFTPSEGSIAVSAVDLGDAVELLVEDTGIGVPPEERERIFDRFYQVDSSARRRYKGTGLGLTICRQIVTQHGGRIWVEAAESEGSQFHVVLPVRHTDFDQFAY